MSDFEINYDTRPYLPDIYIKENIYNSFDAVNNNNNIEINSMIFIFNINRPLDSIYNDPGYLLYGIKKNPIDNYEFPSLNFFYLKKANSNINFYKSSIPEYKIDNNLINLLTSIGYDINNINENVFQYQELLITESINNNKTKVLYLYFNLKNNTPYVNYNNYSSTVYYEDKYFNILIYPYNETIQIPYIPCTFFYAYDNLSNGKLNEKKSINTINFDDRENIKYYEKIDYKYLENHKFTMDSKSDMETLRNYSFNIKNYNEYIKNQKNKVVININLNEICKLYSNTTDYSNKYPNTYTDIYLNCKHINNYKCFCNSNNKYSYTSDNKISNLKSINLDDKKYSCYNYNLVNNQTTYQLVKNYYLNTYLDISEYTNENSIITANIYLHKIFLIINPKIIDKNYLINNVKTNISEIFADSNLFGFGENINKLKIYPIGNIKSTDIYYINKYKITFEFVDENISYSYIIILGIVFYNGNKISILDTNITSNINDLAYTNYTVMESSVSLAPTINNFSNVATIYEEMLNFNIKSIKKYSYILNYKFLSMYDSQFSYIRFINFYSFIPNINISLKTCYDEYYKNVLNILMSNVNNVIKNIININDNFNNFKFDSKNIKNYIENSILFDENIVKKNSYEFETNNNDNDTESESESKSKFKSKSDTNNIDSTKYIEYFTYCPKILLKYLSIDENYVGKYRKVLLNPYTDIDIDSFEIIHAGKYIKFNYINLFAKYPQVVGEEFVKSIKTVNNIINYNFSLLIMLPYNINQDDNFYCSNPKYFWSSEYSMNIGDNHSYIYLVLTDPNGNPYEFYGSDITQSDNTQSDNSNRCCKNTNGIIYGIRLFNHYNYISENLNLKIILNLFFTKYINLTQIILLTETYISYSDSNNVFWNINDSFLKIHNPNCLKEIVYYDFKRFKNHYNKKSIQTQYTKFNYKFLQILSDNKSEINKLRYGIKILTYISNLLKAIKLIQKCSSYCEIIKVNIMMEKYSNQMLISIIKYNVGIISDLFKINYNLNISSGTLDSYIYIELSKIYQIDINNSLENINNYQISCNFIVDYSKNKLDGILELLNSNIVDITNVYFNIYSEIYSLICWEVINYWISEEIIYNIDQLISNTDIGVFNSFTHLTREKKILLLKQTGAFIKITIQNLTKIDELFALAKLMGNKTINIFLPENLNLKVVKDNYVYNTSCYSSCTNVPLFDIVNFLNDTINLIVKLSIEPNNLLFYKNYEKSIQEGILTFINNTIKYFKEIINKIVYIYNYSRDIPDPLNINIYDPQEIGDFYHLLTEFYNNYNSFFDILYGNNINLFYEYDNLKISFDNLFYSCEEFLLYVRLWNDFTNNHITPYTNVYVNEDLYKIIKSDVFYDFLIKSIVTFNDMLVKKNPKLILLYIENIKKNIINKNRLPLKIYFIDVIDKMICELKNEISSGIPNVHTIIMYGSYYIIPYQDLLLYKESFNWASFNFNNYPLELINLIDQLNTTIFNTYYNDPKVTTFYKQALNYTYLSTPYKYININNNIVNA